MPRTEYVILANAEGQHEGPRWVVVGEGEGSSRTSAIRAFIAKDNPVLTEDAGGIYVAIPKRSFIPVVVEAEVQTRIKIG